MIVFLNAQFVPEEEARVSVFDRSFLYGDGLFETLTVLSGKPFRWQPHMDRLGQGADLLKIHLPYAPEQLHAFALELIERNQLKEATMRVHLSRGVGKRGYSIKGADQPTLVMSLHPATVVDLENPPRWKLITSLLRVPVNSPLTEPKTCNKLVQILARQEAEELGADDALILNQRGELAETTSANIFWIYKNKVCTPPLEAGALAGITRALVFELSERLGLHHFERPMTPQLLQEVDGVFLALSTYGVVEVVSLDGIPLNHSPVVEQLRRAYWETVQRESSL